MAAKKATPAEQRTGLQRQIDELDLARLREVVAIFGRPEVVQATADLKALYDDTDTSAMHRSAAADPNALVANALLPLENVPLIAGQLADQLDSRLNPPPAPETPALRTLPPPPAQ